MHLTTRRVLLHVSDIRSRPNGRSEEVQRRILALLRAYLESHPRAARVRELIATIERELARPRAEPLTFGEFASRWLTQRRAAGENTSLAGAILRQRLEPVFGATRLRDLSAADVKRWSDAAGTRSRAVAVERDLLRSILLAAVAEGLIDRVPGEPHLR
jgi:hypothetical protein